MKIDLHVHTSETSLCAHISAAEAIKLYKNAGYDGVVITDHYASYFLARQPLEQAKAAFLRGYNAAKVAGDELGVRVFLGCEVRIDENANDYLVYGIDECFFDDAPDYLKLPIRKFSELCRENNWLLFQAHPFRNFSTLVPPQYLDGIEVHNGNARHDSRNDIANIWADKWNLRKLSGSDFHEVEDLANYGIISNVDVKTNSELVKTLREGKYKMI